MKVSPDEFLHSQINKAASETYVLRKAIEECTELILSICHYQIGRVELNKIMEEAADALLLIYQLREFDRETFDCKFQEKKTRTIQRLKAKTLIEKRETDGLSCSSKGNQLEESSSDLSG